MLENWDLIYFLKIVLITVKAYLVQWIFKIKEKYRMFPSYKLLISNVYFLMKKLSNVY